MMKKVLFLVSLMILAGGLFVYFNSQNASDIAGRGCCSSHSGVCGCQNGRSKCCDGTLSPTCRCFKDDIKGLGM